VAHTLLLADDSVTIQRVIELTFADENIQVVAVSDGDQAIARLNASPPDIVLADIGMPGKNGYEVAQYIKETPRLAHIPVVLLTGAFEPVDHARATAAGCDGVLAKPFEPQQVIGRVKELLARGAAAPPATIEMPLAPPPLQKPAVADIDHYFDRLDAAFANLNKEPAPPPAPASEAAAAPSIDWFSMAAPEPAVPDLPLSYASPEADFDRPAAQPSPSFAQRAAADAVAPPPAPSAAPAPPASSQLAPHLPPIAEAFAALLAAEQGRPLPSAMPQWPTPPGSRFPEASAAPAPAAPAVTEDVIEQVTQRVLERLTDRVVRETVAEIVAATTERLVRDEIARIKSSIK
jgi:CheY-like chemotaxis protein